MEEWEEPLHPGSLPRSYPTFPHNATLIAHFFPLTRSSGLVSSKNARSEGLFGPVPVGSCDGPQSASPDALLQSATLLADRAFARPSLSLPPRTILRATSVDRVSHLQIYGYLHGRAREHYDRFMPSLRPRRLTAALTPILVLATVALAGCGSSSSPGSSADPAGVVPASAPLYAGAVVHPDGTLKTDATTAASTLTHQPDSYARLASVLQVPGSPPLTYSHDIAPWLGPNAGIFLSTLSASAAATSQLQQLLTQLLQSGSSTTQSAWPFASGVQGAIVLDTSDAAKAASFISTEAQHAGGHAASYRGISYQATSGSEAFGIVDRLAVLGTVTGLHSVIDTSLGGPSLVHAADYSKLLSSAPSGALAHVYSNPGAAGANASFATGGAAGAGAQGLGGVIGLLGGDHTLNISVVPSSSSIALDVDSLVSKNPGTSTGGGGLAASASEGSQALGELPGESWLAAGFGNVGITLAGDVQGLHGLASLVTSLGSFTGAGATTTESSSGGFNIKGVLEGFLAPLSALSAPGAQSQRDFLSWMSSAGIFAGGSGIVNLRGGVVLDSKNPSLSEAAVAKLGAALEKSGGSVQSISIPGTDAAISVRVNGLPVELDIANGVGSDGQTKFVIGLGEASVQDALKPSSTLLTAASASTAAGTLGEGIRPSVIVEFAPLLTLLEGVGLAEDPSISHILPYLRSLSTLVGGGKSLAGGIERFRLVAGLQQSG